MIAYRYKNKAVAYNAHTVPWHPKLLDFYMWYVATFKVPLITSTWRSAKIHDKDSGIHITSPLRAIDIRSKDYVYPKGRVATINRRWVYDPLRPEYGVAKLHDTGQGWHIHLQIHPNTVQAS